MKLFESARTPRKILIGRRSEGALLNWQESWLPTHCSAAAQGAAALLFALTLASDGLLWPSVLWLSGYGIVILISSHQRDRDRALSATDPSRVVRHRRFLDGFQASIWVIGVVVLIPEDPMLATLALLLVMVAPIAGGLLACRDEPSAVSLSFALPILLAVSWRLIGVDDFNARSVGAGILILAFVLIILRLRRQSPAGAAGGEAVVNPGIPQWPRKAEDERQARLRAEAALEEALRADRDKTRFLASASHDLRQPIHAVGLFVAALRAESLDAQPRYLVEQLARSLDGLDELFNRLLDISRLDSGGVEPRISAVPAHRIARTLESRFSRVAAERHLAFHIHVTPGLVLHTDPDLLAEILTNLLSNAVRCTSRGGILLAFRGHGAKARVQVWDTGQGIPQSQQARIFEEFVRLDIDGRDRGHCLGLGLAIVRRIATVLDHPVTVRSRIGHGSLFELQVPWTPQPSLATGPATSGGDLIRELAGTQILIVEDDPAVLAAMRSLLASWGCYALAASSVEEALRIVSDAPRFPDLLITDFLLADGQTGEDVVEALSAAVPEPLPVIVVSARQRCALEARARAMGWQLLEKPVSPQALGAAVLRTLGAQVHRPSTMLACLTDAENGITVTEPGITVPEPPPPVDATASALASLKVADCLKAVQSLPEGVLRPGPREDGRRSAQP